MGCTSQRSIVRSRPGDWAVLEPNYGCGRAALDAVTRQAQIIAYNRLIYKRPTMATLAVVPLLIIFTKPSRDVAPDHTQVLENYGS